MLFGIPPNLPADLLHVLARLGHGDDLVLVDANYPFHSDAALTRHGQAIELPGRNLPQALTDILALLPIDTFVDDPLLAMAVPGDDPPVPSVHAEMVEVLKGVPGAPWSLGTLERFEFYERAKRSAIIVRTMERRPYGNIIVKTGVISPEGELMTPERAAAAG